MKKINKLSLILTISYLLLEATLFYFIIFANKYVGALEITSTFITLIYSLCFISKDKNKIYVQSALLFTLIADFCLIILNPIDRVLGMSSFSITQILYFLRLNTYLQSKKEKLISLFTRLSIITIIELIAIVILKNKTDILSVISIFYYTNIITNFLFSLYFFKKLPLFCIGLFLFILCDTIIGLQVANNTYIHLNESSFLYKLVFSKFNLAWFFYLPSQVLIALSINKHLIYRKNVGQD